MNRSEKKKIGEKNEESKEIKKAERRQAGKRRKKGKESI
jgi:hypothetical protein